MQTASKRARGKAVNAYEMNLKKATYMNEYQRDLMIKIVESLITWDICSPFVNDQSNSFPLKNILYESHLSINLTTIKRKIIRNEYLYVEEISNDLNRMFDEVKFISKRTDGIAGIMACEAQYWYNNKVKKLPYSKEDAWVKKAQKIVGKIQDLFRFSPYDE